MRLDALSEKVALEYAEQPGFADAPRWQSCSQIAGA